MVVFNTRRPNDAVASDPFSSLHACAAYLNINMLKGCRCNLCHISLWWHLGRSHSLKTRRETRRVASKRYRVQSVPSAEDWAEWWLKQCVEWYSSRTRQSRLVVLLLHSCDSSLFSVDEKKMLQWSELKGRVLTLRLCVELILSKTFIISFISNKKKWFVQILHLRQCYI